MINNMYTYIIKYLHVIFKCYLNGKMELQITQLLSEMPPGLLSWGPGMTS